MSSSYDEVVYEADTYCSKLMSWKNDRNINFNCQQQSSESLPVSGDSPATPDPTQPFHHDNDQVGSHDDQMELGEEAANMSSPSGENLNEEIENGGNISLEGD